MYAKWLLCFCASFNIRSWMKHSRPNLCWLAHVSSIPKMRASWKKFNYGYISRDFKSSFFSAKVEPARSPRLPKKVAMVHLPFREVTIRSKIVDAFLANHYRKLVILNLAFRETLLIAIAVKLHAICSRFKTQKTRFLWFQFFFQLFFTSSWYLDFSHLLAFFW